MYQGAAESTYGTEEGFSQLPEEAAPPFGAGIGGGLSGEFHIDGTPLRLTTFVVVAILALVLYHYGNFRWHVTI